MSASSKQFFSNILAVIVGVLSALLCLFLLSFICFYMGFIGWTDGGTKAEIRSLEIRTTISLIIIGLISALAGDYICKTYLYWKRLGAGHCYRYSFNGSIVGGRRWPV